MIQCQFRCVLTIQRGLLTSSRATALFSFDISGGNTLYPTGCVYCLYNQYSPKPQANECLDTSIKQSYLIYVTPHIPSPHKITTKSALMDLILICFPKQYSDALLLALFVYISALCKLRHSPSNDLDINWSSKLRGLQSTLRTTRKCLFVTERYLSHLRIIKTLDEQSCRCVSSTSTFYKDSSFST